MGFNSGFKGLSSNLCVKGGPGSVVGIATGYGLDGPGIESRWEARFSAPVQTDPGAHPASCTMGPGSFPGVKSGLGVTLTPHPLLVPWSRKGRAIPLLPLWAVRPVQSLSAYTRAHFSFTLRNNLNKKLRTTYKTTARGTGQQTVQHRYSLMTILGKAYTIAMLNQIHRSWTYV